MKTITPVVSERCHPPTRAQIAALTQAMDDIIRPALNDAANALYGTFGDACVNGVLDLLLSAYINLGLAVEGSTAFAETLAEVSRTVVPRLPGMEAEARAQGRA